MQIYNRKLDKWLTIGNIGANSTKTKYRFGDSTGGFSNRFKNDFYVDRNYHGKLRSAYRFRVQAIDLRFPSDYYNNNSIYAFVSVPNRGTGCSNSSPPSTTTTKPNLSISRLSVTNGNGKQYLPLAAETPTLRRGQAFEVSTDVKNSGNRSSNKTDLRLYVGSSSSINSATEFAILSVPALSVGRSRTVYHSKFIPTSDVLGSFQLSAGRKYYMFLKVDETNINKESNENDNIKSFKFTYSGLSGKPGGDGNCIICEAPFFAKTSLSNFNLDNKKPYNIDVFDFSGQKILNAKVNSLEQENQIIQSLPKNLYIIKSIKGDRKISN